MGGVADEDELSVPPAPAVHAQDAVDDEVLPARHAGQDRARRRVSAAPTPRESRPDLRPPPPRGTGADPAEAYRYVPPATGKLPKIPPRSRPPRCGPESRPRRPRGCRRSRVAKPALRSRRRRGRASARRRPRSPGRRAARTAPSSPRARTVPSAVAASTSTPKRRVIRRSDARASSSTPCSSLRRIMTTLELPGGASSSRPRASTTRPADTGRPVAATAGPSPSDSSTASPLSASPMPAPTACGRATFSSTVTRAPARASSRAAAAPPVAPPATTTSSCSIFMMASLHRSYESAPAAP